MLLQVIISNPDQIKILKSVDQEIRVNCSIVELPCSYYILQETLNDLKKVLLLIFVLNKSLFRDQINVPGYKKNPT